MTAIIITALVFAGAVITADCIVLAISEWRRRRKVARRSAIVQQAQAMCAAYVASVAIREMSLLSIEEALLVKRCPQAEARVKAIVNNAIAVRTKGYGS